MTRNTRHGSRANIIEAPLGTPTNVAGGLVEVPANVEGWTLDVVRALTRDGVGESDRHDFKKDLPEPRNLTKIACAFANTSGGFVVFGVTQENGKWVIDGLPPDHEFSHRAGQRINAEPTIPWSCSPLPLLDGKKALYVLHVPRSDLRPHLPAPADERVFWKRTNRGNEQMTRTEIEAQFLQFEERRSRLKQLALELDYNFTLLHAAPYIRDEPNLDVFETTAIDALLVDAYSLIQDHAHLVQELQGLRRQLRQLRTRRELFVAEMGRGSLIPGRKNPIESYNQYVGGRSRQIKESIQRAESLLKTHFGVAGAAINWRE